MGVKLVSASDGSVEINPPATASNFVATMPARAGGVMVDGPAFSVYCATAQSIPNGTMTKVQLNTELFDTNSNFDPTTNYRFTPTVAGYYQVVGGVYYSFSSGSVQVAIWKNGGQIFVTVANSSTNGVLTPVSGLVYMNGTTDYLELYTLQASGGSQNFIASRPDLFFFNGCMVRGA